MRDFDFLPPSPPAEQTTASGGDAVANDQAA